MRIQNQFILDKAEFDLGSTENAANVINDISQKSKVLWPATKQAVKDAYSERGCRPEQFGIADNPKCWEGAPEVDRLIGDALILGQEGIARSLLATFK